MSNLCYVNICWHFSVSLAPSLFLSLSISISPFLGPGVFLFPFYLFIVHFHAVLSFILAFFKLLHTHQARVNEPTKKKTPLEKQTGKSKWQCAFRQIEIVKCIWVTISLPFAVPFSLSHYVFSDRAFTLYLMHTKSVFCLKLPCQFRCFL